ncbi:MAG: sigma-54-dependent Fis family transcriptional regulator [Alphaproteobacteria bacterium]|nr:sigma-54-dependent Fis family transcriptional regulator [Alphaproteobacteria bacterium]
MLDEAVALEPAASWLARDVDVLSVAQREALGVALSVEPTSAPRYLDIQRPRDPLSESAFAGLVGEGAALALALRQARVMGPDRGLNVLIQGEPGVGKERLAEALHALSSDPRQPFVAVDMASRNDGVIESELFGVLKGGFTGAYQARTGAAGRADGGTLFLDEIGNVSLDLQAKLLRLVQEGEVVPVGGSEPIPVNVRVVAATNADLKQMARQGRFRADLLHRLSGALIELPALREHPEDIPEIVSRFLAQAYPEQNWTVSQEATALLAEAPWEGNVRALQAVIRRAVNRAAVEGDDAVIHPRHLDEGLRSPGVALGFVTSSQPEELFDGPDGPLLTRALNLRWPVPSLRTRSAASRRHLVLHLCGGRVLSEELVERLVGQPWWRGEVSALESWLAVLRLAPPGLITETSLPLGLQALPIAEEAGPLVLMTHAAIDDFSGEVVGQTRTLEAGVVLVGRGRSPWIAPPADPLSQERRRWLDEALQGARGAFVALDDVPALSRAHLLLERSASGIVLRQVPGTNGEVEMRPPSDPRWRPLGVGPTEVEERGVALRFREAGEAEAFLTVLVFDGLLSVQELGHALVSASARGPAHVTRRGGGSGASTLAVTPVAKGPTRWPLSDVERSALIEMLISCIRSGQSRAGFYMRWLSERQDDAELHVLTGFLLAEKRTKKIGTYVNQRIFVDWGDVRLLRALQRRLEEAPDGELLWEKLPAAIRRALEELDDEE